MRNAVAMLLLIMTCVCAVSCKEKKAAQAEPTAEEKAFQAREAKVDTIIEKFNAAVPLEQAEYTVVLKYMSDAYRAVIELRANPGGNMQERAAKIAADYPQANSIVDLLKEEPDSLSAENRALYETLQTLQQEVEAKNPKLPATRGGVNVNNAGNPSRILPADQRGQQNAGTPSDRRLNETAADTKIDKEDLQK